jgi:hypothetical protein
MPGTLRWIMNGTTLIDAPSMAQIPVAVSPSRPSLRTRCPPDWFADAVTCRMLCR